jgi:hypothetical protein
MKKLAVCFALALVAACGSNASNPPTMTASLSSTTVTKGTAVTVTVNATNWTFADPNVMTDVDPNEGHYHVYLDGATGASYLAVGIAGTVAVTIPLATTSGAHTLRVQLQHNNHSALSPNVEQVLNITVN